MYKVISFLLLSILIQAHQIFAQQKPSFGANIGPSISNFSRITFEDQNPLFRITSSISMRSPISKKLAIYSQLAYEKKGIKGEKLGVLDSSAIILIDEVVPITKYNYLTLPVVLEYSIGEKFKYSIGLGAYAAYLIRVKDILDYDKAGRKTSIRRDFRFLNRFDFGLTASANVMYPLTDKLAINVNLLHNRGLNSVVEKEFSLKSVYHRSTNLLFGINYSFSN